ncbi:hypothetical protein [Paenibacillus sp. 453mf]|uniref:hypothetical protein n=1 Tax=Paenibacillus sp. 453mf TaxID=1761874 RepID=UPI0008ED6F2F|nr:hypothetical protein [Paenibacillus sp. 453mf]SFS37982.1 hypothetical protein SAMN04488601_101180 [Paenibacillus sp. 453mf]
MNKYISRIASAALLISIMMGYGEQAGAQETKTPDPVFTEFEVDANCGQGHRLYFMDETAKILNMDLKELASQMEQGKTIASIARSKGMTDKQLEKKLIPAIDKRVDAAVKEGCLTKEQGASMKSNIHARLTKVINTPLSELRKRHAHHGKGHSRLNREEIAKFLGLTPDQLNQELRKGKSLAEIAKSKGVSEKQLVDKLKEELTPDLEKFIHQKIQIDGAPGKEALKHDQS